MAITYSYTWIDQGSLVIPYMESGHRIYCSVWSPLCVLNRWYLLQTKFTSGGTQTRWLSIYLYSPSLWVVASGYLWSTWHYLIGEDFPGALEYFKVLISQLFSLAGEFFPVSKGPEDLWGLGSVSGHLAGASKMLHRVLFNISVAWGFYPWCSIFYMLYFIVEAFQLGFYLIYLRFHFQHNFRFVFVQKLSLLTKYYFHILNCLPNAIQVFCYYYCSLLAYSCIL